MNREPLFASLPVQHRTETSKYAKHMERLRNVKPSVDNGPPRKFIGADGRNGKREFQKQERRFEIEYENAILLDKMRRIMELGTTASNSGVFYVEEPDLTSLNSNVRRRDLERITRENMGIVRRIQVRGPPTRPELRRNREVIHSAPHATSGQALQTETRLEHGSHPLCT